MMDLGVDYDEGEIGFHAYLNLLIQEDFHDVISFVQSFEYLNEESHPNFSRLHKAILNDDLELLECLLASEGIEVNARCSKGTTPLYLAATFGRFKMVEKLIQAGADVNIANNNNDTALHESVHSPDICEFLLRHGARIRTDDSQGGTLHSAVYKDCLEIVHMLLYYNVDANVTNAEDCTPFMVALDCGKVEAQEVLLDYVDDFNRFGFGGTCSTLAFALRSNSPFVKDIIKRGADVNYGDDPGIRDDVCAFSICLSRSVDASTFKMVWERLKYNATKNTIDLLDLFDQPTIASEFLQIIIESDNFKPAVEFFSHGDNYLFFIGKFVKGRFELQQLTVFTCRLLQCGFRASSCDIHMIFSNYGYCELFRILLYMDNDISRGWLLPHMALSMLIFDIDCDLEDIVDEVNEIPKETALQLLEHSICPGLIDALMLRYEGDENMSAILSSMPRMPSLVELARNTARKQIWQSFKITNNCQFFTTIDHLDIATVYKNILTFKKKIYKIT